MQYTSNPIVSIIIPCYNHGLYIRDAIDSIKACNKKDICEVIIIDDGSTDEFTINTLDELNNNGWRVIHQPNKGLSEARNTGISHSAGKYILPLDADNKVYNTYLCEAVDVMEKNVDVAVVYGNANFFGGKTGLWINKPWSFQHILLDNYIDACALIRKSSLHTVNGYSKELVYGYEDWDLWLKLATSGYSFYYLNELCFGYRVVKDSMVRKLSRQKSKSNKMLELIQEKHFPYTDPQAVEDFILQQYKKNPIAYMAKLFIKSYMPYFYRYLYNKSLIRKYF